MGERARQLEMFEPTVARMYQRVHSQQCEKRVQVATRDNPHTGIRLAKAIPPYIKWPIWPAKPRRPKDVPASYESLQKRLEGPKCSATTNVPMRSFNLTSIPRMIGDVTYAGGELGARDRRTLVAMTAIAAERGPQSDRGNYLTRSRELLDRMGVSKKSNKVREEIPGILWRTSRTGICLAAGDPLSGSWGTESFYLIPILMLIKDRRDYLIEYNVPAAANALIQQGKLCTVDLHRLHAIKSPAAESLYFLLYDVAQWSNKTWIEYSTPELAARVGIELSAFSLGGKRYTRWKKIIDILRAASKTVYDLAQYLVDFEIRGSGDESSFVYYFADAAFRKGHLPP
jgi:hypothetical protein